MNLLEYEQQFIKDSTHAKHVQKLALKIFDEVNSKIKELPSKRRKMLEVAAFLHDIGYVNGVKGHNKTSQNIILKNGVEGFDNKELEIISCIARYHRGSKPNKKKHPIYSNLDKKQRKLVKRLSGILRIADGLDHNHVGLVQDLKIEFDDENRICFFVLNPKNLEYRPDISYAIKKRNVFEDAFELQAIFKYA